MFRIIAVLCVCLSGCATTAADDYWRLNRAVSERFTYISDIEHHGVQHYHERGHTGRGPFKGDCEEFSDAIRYQLALRGVASRSWVVKAKQGYHALTCSEDGWCFDANTVPFRREQAPYLFITEME